MLTIPLRLMRIRNMATSLLYELSLINFCTLLTIQHQLVYELSLINFCTLLTIQHRLVRVPAVATSPSYHQKVSAKITRWWCS